MYAPPYELGAVADQSSPFEIAAGLEAWSVDEGDDREIEGVARRHEPGGLA
jgi:hypothetical protein